MSQPPVSIIVPFYKAEKTLARCLNSLLNQTLPGVEIVCVNDGSPDNTLELLKVYAEDYPDQIVLFDKPNGGAYHARLDGINVASGKYIGFLDCDDYAEPDFCEKLYTRALETNADLVVCGFERVEVESGTIVNVELSTPRSTFNTEEEPQRLLEINGAVWNKLFRAELLKESPVLENEPTIFEDIMMQLLIFPKVKRVAFVPAVLIHYQVHAGSITTSISQDDIEPTYKVLLEIRDRYQAEASANLRYLLDAAAFLHTGVSLMFSISHDKDADFTRIMKENRSFLNRNFPTWNSNCIISSENAKRYGHVIAKTYLARKVYNSGLMAPGLSAYRFMIAKLKKDIKW